MSKFQKRLKKLNIEARNAAVIGTGFGRLSEIAEIFDNVFIFRSSEKEFKSRNIIYREDFSKPETLPVINAIFIDLAEVDQLANAAGMMKKFRSLVLIEGSEFIGRDKSLPLYKNEYRGIESLGYFHVWKNIQ